MKKVMFFVLAAVIAISAMLPVLADERGLTREDIPLYSDTDGTVQWFYRHGILKGTGDGFDLSRNVTRAEALAFIERTYRMDTEKPENPHPFTDIAGHWAEETVHRFYKNGFVSGTSEDTYTPDRTVSGAEFTKIFLSVLGYEDITIENAYKNGTEAGLLANNFTCTVVRENMPLLRSDVLRICRSALTAKNAEGALMHHALLENGAYKNEDFEGFLYGGTPAADTERIEPSLVDRLNASMPEDKNYMFSPLSVQMAFAMAANGTSGETQEQILRVLEIEDLDAYNHAAKNLIASYNQSEILQFNIANSLWLNTDTVPYAFRKEFSDTLTEYYLAESDTVTNKNKVDKINGWAKEQTRGKIPAIIQQNTPVEVLLMNALYFKGTWQKEFMPGATKKEIFYSRNGKQEETDFMHKTDYFRYYKDENAEVLELPYQNRAPKIDETGAYQGVESCDLDISMYLVNGSFSHRSFSDKLAGDALSSTYVSLAVPKFEIETEIDLKSIMKDLGITAAFTEGKADLTPMLTCDTQGRYFLTDAFQKSYINVDEKGTEAAVVTALAGGATSAITRPEPIVVRFDKPFTFVIYDNQNSEILFMGEYAFAK